MNLKSHTDSPLFNVLMFSSFWAFQIFITKLGLNKGALVLPYQLVMILVAMATTVVLLLPESGKSFFHLFKQRPKLFWQLFLANAIQTGLGTSLSIVGIALTNAINAGFLVKMSVVTTILFARFLLKESFTFLKGGVLLVMLGGAYLLTTKAQALIPRTGDLLILGACVCWSLGTVLVRKVLRSKTVRADVVTLQKPFASLAVFSIFIAAAVYAPTIFGDLQGVLECCTVTQSSLIYAITSGFCLGMTWIYLFRTLNVATASYMTLISMVTPVIVSILAMVFLNETLNWVQLIGITMILASGITVSRSKLA
jgi:drug/metabolite transporter (DMT)-like permease